MSFDILGIAKSAVKGFAEGGLGGAFKAGLGALMEQGPVKAFLGEAGEKVKDFLENSPFGKLAKKLAPGLVNKVEDFLNPARLGTALGQAADPGQFLQATAGILPGLGNLLG